MTYKSGQVFSAKIMQKFQAEDIRHQLSTEFDKAMIEQREATVRECANLFNHACVLRNDEIQERILAVAKPETVSPFGCKCWTPREGLFKHRMTNGEDVWIRTEQSHCQFCGKPLPSQP
jgi:hypothetical protein